MSALVRLVHAIDRLDWAGVRSVLADELVTDYTSLFGGEPVHQTGDELVAEWQALLPGFTSTQHLLGPVVTDGDRAEAHVRAYHRLDDREWRVAGHYVARVEGGRIASLTLETYYQEGDLDLAAVATDRVENGTVRT